MPPALKQRDYESRPPALQRYHTAPPFALGSLYNSERHGRQVFRMRFYKHTFRSTPTRLLLPAVAIAVAAINAARLVIVKEHIDSDDRYDYFEFHELAVSRGVNALDGRNPALAAISIPAMATANQPFRSVRSDRPPDYQLPSGERVHTNYATYED